MVATGLPWLVLGIAAAALAGGWAIVRLWRGRRPAWHQDLGIFAQATYRDRQRIVRLSFDKLPTTIAESGWRQDVFRLLRRTAVHSALPPVDIEKTVAAFATTLTVQVARKSRLREPRYLLMIEARRPRDHLAAMGRHMASALRRQSVPVEWREYAGDPRTSFAGSQGGDGVDLAMLAARHPEHRLLLVTMGDELVDPVFPKLRATPEFETWDEKFLMTPRRTTRYGRTEAAFRDAGFYVVGLGRRGLQQVGEILEGEGPQEFYRHGWSNSTIVPGHPDDRWVDTLPPTEPLTRELIVGLQFELGRRDFLWLAACAAYPILIPQLTEHLGAILRDDRGHIIGSEDGYLELSTLPWFREGVMPDWLRVALLNELSEPFAAQLREAFMRVLEQAGINVETSPFAPERDFI